MHFVGLYYKIILQFMVQKKNKICCWRGQHIVSSQVLKERSTFIFMVKQPKDWRWRHY